MPQTPDRIEYRSGTALIADAIASADGITLRALDGQGGQLAAVQVGVDGSFSVSTGGATVGLSADGGLVLMGNIDLQGTRLHLNLPTADPHDDGVAYLDGNRHLVVSAG